MLFWQTDTGCCGCGEGHAVDTGETLSIAGEAPEFSVNVVVFKQAIVLIRPVLAIMPSVTTLGSRDASLGLSVPFRDREDCVHLFIFTEKLVLITVKALSSSLVEHSKS